MQQHPEQLRLLVHLLLVQEKRSTFSKLCLKEPESSARSLDSCNLPEVKKSPTMLPFLSKDDQVSMTKLNRRRSGGRGGGSMSTMSKSMLRRLCQQRTRTSRKNKRKKNFQPNQYQHAIAVATTTVTNRP
jgi:hypothetical protein